MVSVQGLLKILFKVLGLLLLIGSGMLAYQLTTTSFAAIPVIGVVMVFFILLMVIGSFIILIT